MTNEQLWQATLGELELLISRVNFTTWFKNTFIVSLQDNHIIIGTPNTFTKAWLEKKYHQHILQALKNIVKLPEIKVEYVVETSKPALPRTPVDAVAPRIKEVKEGSQPVELNKFGLNKKYRFENFIVGSGNQLAHAASKAVAERPGTVYNPLFIYGGVGLGKTHLVQAIGNQILDSSPQLKLLYINSERFTNDFVQAIKSNQTESFKKLYRTVDVLLIDDVHFMSGKEQTQEEFFHTFNALHQNNKQIVLSSDRPPKAIPDIEQRLVSRFEWGMIADINPPNLETRVAILEAKCQEKNFSLPNDVIVYLAQNIQNNVRELEGALNRIIANYQLTNADLNLETVKQILQVLTASSPRSSLTPKKIIQIVSSYYDIRIEDITGACRRKELVVPRQIVMYLMREEIKSSYPSIGQELGGRDHTTAIHACNKISLIIERGDERLKNDILLIKEKLYHE